MRFTRGASGRCGEVSASLLLAVSSVINPWEMHIVERHPDRGMIVGDENGAGIHGGGEAKFGGAAKYRQPTACMK